MPAAIRAGQLAVGSVRQDAGGGAGSRAGAAFAVADAMAASAMATTSRATWAAEHASRMADVTNDGTAPNGMN